VGGGAGTQRQRPTTFLLRLAPAATVAFMTGDPACWLSEVCEECGRMRENPERDVCENCGHRAGAPPRPLPPSRDRDEAGRARNSRPRDGLGRPLPYGSVGVERAPEGVLRAPEATLAEAQRLLDAGMPFHAHEVLEDAWKTAPGSERALWRGLAQLAVGLTHAMRGNSVGARSLLLRGVDNIEAYGEHPPHGVNVNGLVGWARGVAADLDVGVHDTHVVPSALQSSALKLSSGTH
jgi:hypothetical protein